MKTSAPTHTPRAGRWARIACASFGATGLAASLVACGGDDSSPPPPATTSITMSGTASDGAALASRPVEARCSRGTGSATTGADGGYQINIEGGAFPCLLATSSAGGPALHGVATSSNNTATANLTPFTELVLANLTGSETGAYYAAFDATTAASVTPEAVGAATAATLPVIASAGVDTSTLGNVLTAPVDSSYTTALGSLNTALGNSGTTLAQLSTATADGSANNTAPSATASLPAAMLLQPQASNCAALRSGTYRVIDPHYASPDEPEQSYLISIDASTLVVTDLRDNTTEAWTPNGDCRFLDDDGVGELVVSPSGIGVVRYSGDAGRFGVALAIPEQAHAVAELAATWNLTGMELDTGDSADDAVYDFSPFAGVTITSTGVVSPPGITESISIQANPAGGFDMVNTTAGWTDRYYAYRAGGGELMLIGTTDNGSFSLWTRQLAVSLPDVGTRSTFWGLPLNTSLASSATFAAGDFTVTAVDAAAGSWARVNNLNGVSETILADNPDLGYSYRAGGTGTGNNGTSVTINEAVRLRLRGMGLTVSWLPTVGLPAALGSLYLSVDKP